MVTKQISQALEQLFSGKSFSQSIDQIPGNVFIKDTEGVNYACNQAVRSIVQQDITGKTDYEFLDKQEADQLRENDKKVMQSKQTMVFIETVHCPGRGLVSFCSIKAPVLDQNGNVLGIIGQAIDIEGIKDQLRTL